MTISIVLAEDHKIVREGLYALLQSYDWLNIVATTDNGRDAIDLVDQYNPDIIIMDINMPGLNGIEATRLIKKHNEKIKVIALSMYDRKKTIRDMFNAGAASYLIKDNAIVELIEAIKAVTADKKYISSSIAGTLIEDYTENIPEEKHSNYSKLSKREREVLQLLAEGFSTKEMSNRLFISDKTINTHRQQIMNKLDIHNIAELTRFAIKEGISFL